jgi:hypothetical protein
VWIDPVAIRVNEDTADLPVLEVGCAIAVFQLKKEDFEARRDGSVTVADVVGDQCVPNRTVVDYWSEFDKGAVGNTYGEFLPKRDAK